MSRDDHTPDTKTTATFVHLFGLVSGFVGPAIVYYLTDDEYTKRNARNAFNWQVSFLLGIAALVGLAAVETFTSVLFGGLGIIALAFVIDPVLCLIASIRSRRGNAWGYGVALPVLR